MNFWIHRIFLLTLQHKHNAMIELFKTYNKAKNVFVRPKLKVYFGKWFNTPGLPVWRQGPIICLGNDRNSYKVNNFLYVQTGTKIWKDNSGKEHTSNVYDISRHKLPGGLWPGDRVWNREIRKKLKKWHLGWIKPNIQLPIWLSFHIFNWDVFYKWKYDEIRYEFPPQFTIVFFGLALTIMAVPEPEDDDDCPDHYWESLLSYLYQDECEQSIEKTLNFFGQWTKYDAETGKRKFFQLRKSHIKPEYHAEYDKAVDKYISQHLKKESLC